MSHQSASSSSAPSTCSPPSTAPAWAKPCSTPHSETGQPRWTAEDNPRARAFYARNGFTPDGARKVEPSWEDLAEVRLVRQ